MRSRFILVLGMIMTALALHAATEPTELADSIRAVVADTPITQQQVEQFVDEDQRALADRYANQPDIYYKRMAALEESASELLIQRQVILQEFKAKIKVPESLIDSYVQDKIKERFGGDNVELTKYLERLGISLEEYKRRVREQFIVGAMQEKFVPEPIISPKKVEDYYLAHKNDFKVEDQVHMRMIVLNKSAVDSTNQVQETQERAKEILVQLKGGASFSDLARTYSEGSSSREGGDRGWEDASALNKMLIAELDKLKPGQYSGVIETPTAYYLVQLEERHPAHFKQLSEVRDQIERTLDSQERERLAKQWISRLEAGTFIVKY